MIIKNENICNGAPIIQGTRITVAVILANLRDGSAFTDITNDFPQVSNKDIEDCLDYAIEICK